MIIVYIFTELLVKYSIYIAYVITGNIDQVALSLSFYLWHDDFETKFLSAFPWGVGT